TDFPLQRQMLGIWYICRWKCGACVIGGKTVVTEPCLEGVTNATRKDQKVIFDAALSGSDPLFVAVDAVDLGLNEVITVLAGRPEHVMHEKVAVDDIDQPLVAHGARPENRVPLQHHHFGIGRGFAEMTRSGEPSPSPSGDHDPLLAASGQELR